MKRRTHRLSLVCYLGGKNFASMSKPRSSFAVVVGFIGEVLACVGQDVSCDVDGVNPTHVCHRSFGVVRRNKEVCEGGRELIFFRRCCSSSLVIDWESQGDDPWLCFR